MGSLPTHAFCHSTLFKVILYDLISVAIATKVTVIRASDVGLLEIRIRLIKLIQEALNKYLSRSVLNLGPTLLT